MSVLWSQRSPSILPTHLAVFAKYWKPGQVKTRLASRLGAEAASSIQREFLDTILRRFRGVADRRTLVFWPQDSEHAFRRFIPTGWGMVCQSPGDLGIRLSRFFESRFEGGRERVLAIGSDSPDLPPALVENAFHLLLESRVVLGPANDGGYHLVGMNELTRVFDHIEWGTPAVFTQTVRQVEALGVNLALTAPWDDVDDWPSFLKLQQRLNLQSDCDILSQLKGKLGAILTEVSM